MHARFGYIYQQLYIRCETTRTVVDEWNNYCKGAVRCRDHVLPLRTKNKGL